MATTQRTAVWFRQQVWCRVAVVVVGLAGADLAVSGGPRRRALAPTRQQRRHPQLKTGRGAGMRFGKIVVFQKGCPTLRGGYTTKGGSSSAYDDFYGLDDGWGSEAYVNGDAYAAHELGDSREAPNRDAEPPRESPLFSFDASSLPVPDRKTGLIMTAAGAAFTMLGISLFFEKNLIRLGNILLVLGAPVVVGPKRTAAYLTNPTKLRGSLVFAFGFFMILTGHPLLGILIELFGFFNLFGNLFPLLGHMLTRLPFVTQFTGGFGGAGGAAGGGGPGHQNHHAGRGGLGGTPDADRGFGPSLDPRDYSY